MRTGTALALAAMMITAPASAQEALPLWMLGSWCTPVSRGWSACETWSAGPDGTLVGTAQPRPEITETMRITAEPGRLVFRAEPAGQAITEFYAAGPQPALSIAFENRAHDYPQRVRYWREGELLLAEISLADGGKPALWTYRRVAP